MAAANDASNIGRPRGSADPESTLSERAFREAIAHFATGVTVVTTTAASLGGLGPIQVWPPR